MDKTFSKTEASKQNTGLKQTLPGYTFIKELGHGAQGQVLLGERQSDGLKVAIKRLNVDSVKTWKEYDLFKREAAVLASLDVNGVAKFYDAIERLDDNPPCSYIVQEYIDGKSMADMLKTGHRFSLDTSYDIIMQLINILEMLHSHNPPVIHRDIKPSNILLKPIANHQFKVYLIDFGAVANPQIQGGGSTVAGTFGYMPPEQLMGKPVPASDIYALGAVAVHMFTGKSPADMPQKDFHLIFEPEMESMPVALVNTLRSMLEPNVENRLCNYEELYGLFNAFHEEMYEQTGSRQKRMSLEEFDQKLQKVETYIDAGNIELWQELSDHLPRELNALPPSYLRIDKHVMNYHSNGMPVFPVSSFDKVEKVEKSSLNSFLRALQFILAMPFLIASIVFLRETFRDFSPPLIILLMILYFVLTGYLIHKICVRKKRIKGMISLPRVLTTGDDTRYITSLLSNGRKTIATVVSVEYIRCVKNLIEENYKKESDNSMARYCYHTAPLFKLSYKFNPPDDEKEEDLVHHIYTHVEPEKLCRPGDPLPILYRIYENEDSLEIVDSMPFPLQFNDICDISNAVYHLSRGERRRQHKEAQIEKIRAENANRSVRENDSIVSNSKESQVYINKNQTLRTDDEVMERIMKRTRNRYISTSEYANSGKETMNEIRN